MRADAGRDRRTFGSKDQTLTREPGQGVKIFLAQLTHKQDLQSNSIDLQSAESEHAWFVRF